MRALWLLAVLRRALVPRGHAVQTVPGWEARGRAGWGPIRWLTDHHTASSPRGGNMASLWTVTYGRPGLSGPLSQLHTARDGTTTVVAAGRANHAGYGTNPDGTNPNTTSIGRESENSGVGEPWPTRQMAAIAIGDAALLNEIGQDSRHVRGHKEVDPRRKIDPTYDMDVHRVNVARYQAELRGATPANPGNPANPTKDWFDMSTEADREEVRTIVAAEVNRAIGAIWTAEAAAVKRHQAIRVLFGSIRGWSAAAAEKLYGDDLGQARDRAVELDDSPKK